MAILAQQSYHPSSCAYLGKLRPLTMCILLFSSQPSFAKLKYLKYSQVMTYIKPRTQRLSLRGRATVFQDFPTPSIAANIN